MGFAIIFVASVPAYLAAGIALVFGAGWLLSLTLLAVTGLAICLLLVALQLRVRLSRDEGPALSQTA